MLIAAETALEERVAYLRRRGFYVLDPPERKDGTPRRDAGEIPFLRLDPAQLDSAQLDYAQLAGGAEAESRAERGTLEGVPKDGLYRIGHKNAPNRARSLLLWFLGNDVHRVTSPITIGRHLSDRSAPEEQRCPNNHHYWNALLAQRDFLEDELPSNEEWKALLAKLAPHSVQQPLEDRLPADPTDLADRPNLIADLACILALAGAKAVGATARVAVVRTRNVTAHSHVWVEASSKPPPFGVMHRTVAGSLDDVGTKDQRVTALLLAGLRPSGVEGEPPEPWMHNPGSGRLQPSRFDKNRYRRFLESSAADRQEMQQIARPFCFTEPATYVARHAWWVLCEADATAGKRIPIVFRAQTHADLQAGPSEAILTPGVLDQRDWPSALRRILRLNAVPRLVGVQLDAPTRSRSVTPILHEALLYEPDPDTRVGILTSGDFGDVFGGIPEEEHLAWFGPLPRGEAFDNALRRQSVPRGRQFGVYRYTGMFRINGSTERLQALHVHVERGWPPVTVAIVGSDPKRQPLDHMTDDQRWELIAALAFAYYPALEAHLGHRESVLPEIKPANEKERRAAAERRRAITIQPGGCFDVDAVWKKGSVHPDHRENSVRINSAIYGLLNVLNQMAGDSGDEIVWDPFTEDNSVGECGIYKSRRPRP